MRSLADLPTDELKLAHDAATVLVTDYKAYLPPGGLLRMLLSRFRDDTREALGLEVEGLPAREDKYTLDELTSVELDTVAGAVIILLQDRFTAVMDDPDLPKLLGDYQIELNAQKTERAEIKASMSS